jgi:hypothetical protein
MNTKKLTIIVLNFSGNIGKSVISRHLLAPRLNAKVVSVETINANDHDKTEVKQVKANQFKEIMETIFSIDDTVIIDVGSSNVEIFLDEMITVVDSHEDIDYFVIPTTPETKTQIDTIKTMATLSQLGIEADKIRLVFNKITEPDKLEYDFNGIFLYHAESQSFKLQPSALIRRNDLYSLLAGKQIKEILEDPNDYKELASNKSLSQEERLDLRSQLTRQRLAKGVNQELDAVFNALFS